MTILFAGGEEGDLTKIGANCTVDTTTAGAFRSAYARCALKLVPGSGTDGWVGTLSTPSAEFWLTGRFLSSSSSTYYQLSDMIALTDGATRRIVLTTDTVNSTTSHYVLAKRNAAGVMTTLATSVIYTNAGGKIDMHVTYGTAGKIDVYIDGTLILTYTGDVTTDAATTLSGFVLGAYFPLLYSFWWSEIIAATIDTRSLTLATLAPLGAGNANTWASGSYADLNDITLSDGTVAISTAAGQLLETTIINTAPATATAVIVAVVVSARAQKATTGGPDNIAMVVRAGGIDYVSSSIALPTSLGRVGATWESNPATGVAWTRADLAAAGFNIGIKSLA